MSQPDPDPHLDEPDPARGADSLGDEAVGHLQAAATEMIAAARAFLDLLEDVVEDDQAMSAAAGAIGSLAKAAMKATRPATEYGSAGAEGAPREPGDGVHHIRIS